MQERERHRIVLAASEVVGFAKTGGLADVAGALPRALAARGHSCAVILPLYRCARTGSVPVAPTEHTFSVPVGGRPVVGRVWRSTLPDSDVPVYLVEQPEFFDRDDPRNGRGLYQQTLPDGTRGDYSDNCARFVFFSRAVLEVIRLLDLWPDVLHVNDWQTGLVPVYLKEEHARHGLPGVRERYAAVRTLFTIHNIAYQGIFWHWDMPLTGLPWSLFNYRQLEFHGYLNFLKGGIVFADLLNTVSPTYAREIQTRYYGFGLEGVLAERADRLFGIVNGVDVRIWDPATDPHLPAHYDATAIEPGKAECKAALQRRCGLRVDPRTPLLGVVSRLVEQKGISLITAAAATLLNEDDVQLVVLGEGEPNYQRELAELQRRFAGRVSLTIGFDEPFAHLIEAGADLFLMPSLYEPSGLNQLYSLRYGTVPVVRATGGLADTITDCTPQTLADGTATGFTFVTRTPEALRQTVERALDLRRRAPAQWRQVMETGMGQDWSWAHSAAEYERLYSLLRSESSRHGGGGGGWPR